MSKVFKSLDAVTADGIGEEFDLYGLADRATLMVTGTGLDGQMAGGVLIEVSMDGDVWFPLGTPPDPWYSTGIQLTEVAGRYLHNSEVRLQMLAHYGLFRHVRARLLELAGGTSPTVTAWIAVRDIEPI